MQHPHRLHPVRPRTTALHRVCVLVALGGGLFGCDDADPAQATDALIDQGSRLDGTTGDVGPRTDLGPQVDAALGDFAPPDEGMAPDGMPDQGLTDATESDANPPADLGDDAFVAADLGPELDAAIQEDLGPAPDAGMVDAVPPSTACRTPSW